MLDTLLFYADLYREPIITATIAGLILGLLGVYIVSRRIVFVSAALTQTSALGITLGFIATAYLGTTGLLTELLPLGFASLLAFGLVFALVFFSERPTLSGDAILGVAFILPTALVLLLAPLIAQELHEVDSILHGSAVLTRRSDLYALGFAALLVLGSQAVAFRGFIFASLDPQVAQSQGVPVRLLDAILLGTIALSTGLATRALGALPTFGLTLLPAIAALSLRIGLRQVFIVAALLGAASGALGFLLAILTDWSVGASQILTAAAFALIFRLLGLFHRTKAP